MGSSIELAERVSSAFGGNPRMTRRNVLKGAAALGVAVFFAGCGTDTSPQSTPEQGNPYVIAINEGSYKNWANLGTLSPETVQAIGADIASSSLPGFKEVGEIMQALQTPASLHAYFSMPTPEKPVGIIVKDLVTEADAIGALQLETHVIAVDAALKENKTGNIQKMLLGQVERINAIGIEMDTSFVNVPDVIKQLILVKEFSHFLFIAQHMDLVKKQVLEHFTLVEPKNPLPDLATFLYFNGRMKETAPQLTIPSLTDLFDHAFTDLDGAGYFYIMPAYGWMKRQTLSNGGPLLPDELTTQSDSFLHSDEQAFQAAISAGLLIEKTPGEFIWKEGIGPFSPEWTGIMRPIFKQYKAGVVHKPDTGVARLFLHNPLISV